jgi:hypothetical protein
MAITGGTLELDAANVLACLRADRWFRWCDLSKPEWRRVSSRRGRAALNSLREQGVIEERRRPTGTFEYRRK